MINIVCKSCKVLKVEIKTEKNISETVVKVLLTDLDCKKAN
jgi:hypothetical protein